MKVGDLVRIKQTRNTGRWYLNKLAIVVASGTWSVDVRVIENGMNPRIAKEDCEVISSKESLNKS